MKALENYLRRARLEELFNRLGADNAVVLAENIRHFSLKEAKRRDQIALGYFGVKGVNRIADKIVELLLEPPTLKNNASILDIGAGSGFFTIRIAKKMRVALPDASFYAMDLTPAMLLSLARKKAGITVFLGIAENLADSVRDASKHFPIPDKFDAVFSTLMLHHSSQPRKVFESMRRVLSRSGRAVVVDMCRHCFEEFQTEMGDVHLGFEPEAIRAMAEPYFRLVKVEKLPGIRCESSGRAAELFVVYMKNGLRDCFL